MITGELRSQVETGFAFKSSDYSSNKDDINLCGGLIITPSGIE